MTTIERIEVRDIMNNFSDRWPDTYHDLYHRVHPDQFEATILWNWINRSHPDQQENRRVFRLIDVLNRRTKSVPLPITSGKTKIKIEITEIEGGL